MDAPQPATLDVPVPAANGSAPKSSFVLRWVEWDYVAIFLVIVLVAGLRFGLRNMALERDEGEYGYAGQLILHGIPPYKLAYSMKLPGTYVAYAAVMAVFGQSAAGIHTGLALLNAASIWLLFLIARKLFDPAAAVVAGAAFGLFCMRPDLMGLAGHATHFVTLFALLATYLVLKAVESDNLALYFASGLSFGIAFLMKQPGIFFGIFGALYVCQKSWPAPGQLSGFLKKLVTYAAGAILPYALTCLILWRSGVFAKFWFWTVSYAEAYGAELSAWVGLQRLANAMAFQKEHIEVVWLLVVVGMVAFLWDRSLKPHSLFMLEWLACSFLALSAGIVYRPHYFLLIYPVWAMLAGVGVSAAIRLLRRGPWPKAITAIPVILFAFGFANELYADRRIFFLDSADRATREVYGDVPFPEGAAIGQVIREHSDPNARVAVLGSEPEILFYARRLSATGYIYTYPLLEAQPFAHSMQSEYIHEVETAEPEFVVSIMIAQSWERQPHSDDFVLRWADAYLHDHYVLMGIADGGNHDVFRWGPEAAGYRPRRPTVILIFRRRP